MRACTHAQIQKKSSKSCLTIHVIRVSEEEMKWNGAEKKIEEVTVKSPPKIMQDTSQMQESQRTSSRRN